MYLKQLLQVRLLDQPWPHPLEAVRNVSSGLFCKSNTHVSTVTALQAACFTNELELDSGVKRIIKDIKLIQHSNRIDAPNIL